MARALRRVHGADEKLRELEGNVADVLAEINSIPLANARLLTDANGQPFTITAGQANRIPHGFGVRVRWVPISQSASASIYELAADEELPDRFLHLRASATVDCFLLVFPA